MLKVQYSAGPTASMKKEKELTFQVKDHSSELKIRMFYVAERIEDVSDRMQVKVVKVIIT